MDAVGDPWAGEPAVLVVEAPRDLVVAGRDPVEADVAMVSGITATGLEQGLADALATLGFHDEQVVHHQDFGGDQGVEGGEEAGKPDQAAVLLRHQLDGARRVGPEPVEEGLERRVLGLGRLVEIEVGADQGDECGAVRAGGRPDVSSTHLPQATRRRSVREASTTIRTQKPRTTPVSSWSTGHDRSAPRIITLRSPSTAYVSGSTLETTCIQPGSVDTGTRIPLRRNCGTITRGMNWTAWNSVRANMLTKMPRLTAAIAINTTTRKMSHTLPAL